jgi:hypothetical protein
MGDEEKKEVQKLVDEANRFAAGPDNPSAIALLGRAILELEKQLQQQQGQSNTSGV